MFEWTKKDKQKKEKEKETVDTSLNDIIKEDNKKTKSIYYGYSNFKLVLVFCMPAIISLLLESLTSVIDLSFAGHIVGAGHDGITAIGLIGPILTLFVAMQLLFSPSTAILISRFLGEGHEEKANKAFWTGCSMSFIISTITSVLIFIFRYKILGYFGAEGRVFDMANDYLSVACIFNVFSSVGYTLINCLRSYGYPGTELLLSILFAIINTICNTVFTFVLNMGVFGIALGTLIAEIIGVIIPFIFLVKKKKLKKPVKISREEFTKISMKEARIGAVDFLSEIVFAVVALLLNNIVITYCTIAFIPVKTVVEKVNEMFMMPLVGLSESMQPVLSYMFGDNNKKKIKGIVKTILVVQMVYSVFVLGMSLLFPEVLLGMFNANMPHKEVGIALVQIIMSSIPAVCIIYTVQILFQVTNNEKKAITIGLIMELFAFVPLIFTFPFLAKKFLNMQYIYGIFMCQPISDVITFVIVIALLVRFIKQQKVKVKDNNLLN